MTDTEAQPAAAAELPEDAIEAAAQVLHHDAMQGTSSSESIDACWEDDADNCHSFYRDQARAIVAAALPFLERATRDKIADEVKRLREQYDPRYHQLAINANHMAEVTVREGFARGGEATE